MKELAPEKTDLLTLGAQVLDIVSFQAQQKNIELLHTQSQEVPRFIMADAVRLRQVLVNLMGNAVKFTEDGEIELRVEVIGDRYSVIGNQSPTTDYRPPLTEYRFSVRDTGLGIQPENQKKIFEAFSQEDASVTKKYGGTGLGLPISNKLLGLMGSKLELHSEPGKGSTFYFEVGFEVISDGGVQISDLPEPAIHQLSKISSPKSEIDQKAEIRNLKSEIIKILIVDDNMVNLALARIIVKNIMPQALIVEASNGKLAVEQFMQSRPDIIFMDVQMPEMNGHEATREIRKIEVGRMQKVGSRQATDHRLPNNDYQPVRTPIIALTAGAIAGEREKCLAAGMDDFVTKPIVNKAIEAVMRKWLTH